MQQEVLRWAEAAIRRAEKFGFKIGFTPGHIFNIGSRRGFPTIEVMKGMVPDCMASPFDLFKGFRMLLHIIAHHKKGCLHSIPVKYGKDFGGCLRDGAIVESKVDDIPISLQVAHQIARA